MRDGHEEAALVRRTLDGDAEAFEGLVAAYESVLFNAALRMTNDREEARDLTQSAFLKAYRRLETFDPRHRFFSWIYRILLNETLNALARRRTNAPLDEEIVDGHPGPEEQMALGEVQDIVHDALMELSDEDRHLVIMRHLMEMSHREMGALVHVPEKTVKSRLYSARQRLAAILIRRGVRTA
jgi:RNA polymerase sigma-70 factor (ECF subfamily)